MRKTQSGFSFLEVVIASLLLLVIAVGVLPLFTQAASSNEAGREYMLVSNFAKSRAEQFAQLPFNDANLTITSGTQLVLNEYYSAKSRSWVSGATVASGDQAMWTRTTTVRQFGITDLTTPLPAGADPTTIHVKEVTVDVQGVRLGIIFGSGKKTTVRMFKSQ
jgi:Tfp pilus assembly protein PilV